MNITFFDWNVRETGVYNVRTADLLTRTAATTVERIALLAKDLSILIKIREEGKSGDETKQRLTIMDNSHKDIEPCANRQNQRKLQSEPEIQICRTKSVILSSNYAS